MFDVLRMETAVFLEQDDQLLGGRDLFFLFGTPQFSQPLVERCSNCIMLLVTHSYDTGLQKGAAQSFSSIYIPMQEGSIEMTIDHPIERTQRLLQIWLSSLQYISD